MACFWILLVFLQNLLRTNLHMHFLFNTHWALGQKMLWNIRVKKASWGNVGCCLWACSSNSRQQRDSFRKHTVLKKKSSGWWWNSYESVCVWLCICVCERQQHRKRQLKVECVSVEGVPYNGEGPPVYTSLPPAFFSGPPLEGLIADSQLTALWEPSTGTTKNSWSLRGLPEREREGHGEERAWRIGKIEQE